MNLKRIDELERNRVVLYREDYRQMDQYSKNKLKKRFYIIEISKNKYKLFIVAVKLPKTSLKNTLRGWKKQINVNRNKKAKMYCIEMSEKQGKKILVECNYEFRNLVNLLFVKDGKLFIHKFDQLMKYGG